MSFAPTLTTHHRPVARPHGQSFLRRLSVWSTVGFVVLAGLVLMAVIAFAVYGLRYSDRVYEGATMAGIDVSGMTRSDVAVAMDDRFADFATSPVVFTDGATTFEIPVAELGIALDREATIERAMGHGRMGSYWDRSIDWTNSFLHGRSLQPALTVDHEVFRGAMQSIAPEVTSLPVNAYVDLSQSGTAVLVEDTPGRSLSVTTTRERVVRALGALEQEPVALAIVLVPADVLTADVEGGLPAAERAVGQAMTLRAAEGTWGLSRTQLSSLVSVDGTGQLRVDEDGVRAFVDGVARQIDRDAVNAGITVDDQGALVVVPQVDSATVNGEATTGNLISAIEAGEPELDLVVERSAPAIVDATALEWAGRAEQLVGEGLKLTWAGGSSQLGRADLLAALVITPQPAEAKQFALSFDSGVLAERLAPLEDDLTVPMANATFRLVDGTIRYLSEARQGREVDIDATVGGIVDAVEGGDGQAPVVLHVIEPDHTGAERGSISLPDVLGESRTYYGNSSEPRRHNVDRATELEDGWLVPPGGVFSYAEVMGLVDEANGFVTGFGIVADENGGVTTAPVIGGGICQVSTTIFQAAFWAGLAIEERWAHPYWLLTYGEAPYGMQGLDAMVNIEPGWALDLKFRNTTDNWIALVMVADGENVYAEIRGTDPGWSVDVPAPVISNIVQPERGMVFTDSSELPRGQELQVEHAREGFTSTITRTVRDSNGEVIDEYVLESSYLASRDRTLRGTGTGT